MIIVATTAAGGSVARRLEVEEEVLDCFGPRGRIRFVHAVQLHNRSSCFVRGRNSGGFKVGSGGRGGGADTE